MIDFAGMPEVIQRPRTLKEAMMLEDGITFAVRQIEKLTNHFPWDASISKGF